MDQNIQDRIARQKRIREYMKQILDDIEFDLYVEGESRRYLTNFQATYINVHVETMSLHCYYREDNKGAGMYIIRRTKKLKI